MKTALRSLVILLIPVVAVIIAADELFVALGPVVAGVLYHLGWTLWVCGPVVMAVCLAILPGDRFVRTAADVAAVLMTLLNIGAAAFSALLPWVTLGEVFRFLPFFEYSGLTLILLGPLLFRGAKAELPKIRSLATLLRR